MTWFVESLAPGGCQFDILHVHRGARLPDSAEGYDAVMMTGSPLSVTQPEPWMERAAGFMVDAAIVGFAVGTGFALIENTYYVHVLSSHNIGVWLVRGLGTAVMHGGMTAIYGIVTRTLVDRWGPRWTTYTPALGMVILAHSIYNHFILPPITATTMTKRART